MEHFTGTMEHLTGINIRIALQELDIPVKDVIKVNTEARGDERLHELFQEGNKKTFLKYPDLERLIDENDIMVYSEKKTGHKLNETLTAYVFNSYSAYRNFSRGHKIITEKTLEIEFVNSEMLNFDSYCHNLMTAQAFTGNYSTPIFLYPFIGIGNFSLEDYVNIHQIVINSNFNMNYFFVYYKKILSSIDNFLGVNYETDIRSQQKYLNEKEYRSIMKTLKSQRHLVASQMGDDNFFGDLSHPGE